VVSGPSTGVSGAASPYIVTVQFTSVSGQPGSWEPVPQSANSGLFTLSLGMQPPGGSLSLRVQVTDGNGALILDQGYPSLTIGPDGQIPLTLMVPSSPR
jgi:hypothetical protein